MTRVLLVAGLLCLPVGLSATTLVIFKTAGRVILATDSAAVRLDADGRHHVQIDCKVRQAGRFWFVIGGFLASDVDERDVIAAKLATVATVTDALTAIDDPALRDRIRANKQLYAGRHAGSPLMTVVIADNALAVGVLMVSLRSAEPFEVEAESGTCPGRLCPTGGYYLIGEPGDAPPNPLLKALPAWFKAANAAAARQFITEQIAFTPTLARPPIDVLEIRPDGARWIDRDRQSTCSATEPFE